MNPTIRLITGHAPEELLAELEDAGTLRHELGPMLDNLVHQVVRVDQLSPEEALELRAVAAPAGVFVTYTANPGGKATLTVLVGGTAAEFERLLSQLVGTTLEPLVTRIESEIPHLPRR